MNLSVESSPNLYHANKHSTPTISSHLSSVIVGNLALGRTEATTSEDQHLEVPNMVNYTSSNAGQTNEDTDPHKVAVHLLVPKGSGRYRSSSFSSSSSSSGSSSVMSSDDIVPNDNYSKGKQAQSLQSLAAHTQASIKNNSQLQPPPPQQQQQLHLIQQNPVIPAKPANITYKILPENFKDCARDDLIVIISRMLTHIISLNDEIDVKISSKQLTRFHSRAPPNISIYAYLSRLAHYSSLENAILIAAVYYIDLLSATYPVFSINSLTVHRFLLTLTTVGSKGLCDSFCSNNHYLKVGGVHISELNVLELEFLTNVNWRVVPRDFTQQQDGRRDSSTGTLDELNNGNAPNKYKTSVASLEEVLDLYYKRMISLFGADTSKMTADIPDQHAKYRLQSSDQAGASSSSVIFQQTESALKKRSADDNNLVELRGKRRI